jgi:hypothetical protein
MTEFRRSPVLTASEPSAKLPACHLSGVTRVAAFHVGAFYGDLLERGPREPWPDRMQTRDEL